MDLQMESSLARERLDEARAFAARWHLVASLRPERRPARVVVGLALIRLGRMLAAREPRPAGAPDRAAA